MRGRRQGPAEVALGIIGATKEDVPAGTEIWAEEPRDIRR
jgi:hypothetical protein